MSTQNVGNVVLPCLCYCGVRFRTAAELRTHLAEHQRPPAKPPTEPSVKPGTDLSNKMRARADADGLPADHDLRIKADLFDKATTGFYGAPQTVNVAQFMGNWSRARRAWCDYSGEPLV